MARILLAEGAPLVRTYLLEALVSDSGHKVIAVSSGTHAVGTWSNEQFDLLLMNYRLGNMTADEVLTGLSGAGHTPNLVIMYSSEFEEEGLESHRQRLTSLVPGSLLVLLPRGVDRSSLLAAVASAYHERR